MASRFSSASSSSPAKFKKHHVYEVATSLSESKYIASDLADTHRYAYRAKATVVGTCTLRPYDPIYLDGLPNDMSGYWTVLSVHHVFGGTVAPYMIELELGTDKLGDTNPNAKNTSENRNVNSEIAGQSLTVANSTLSSYDANVNANSVPVPRYVASPQVTFPVTAAAEDPASGYNYTATVPNYGVSSLTTTWTATKGSAVL